jgi:hypothetical protein
MHSIRPTAVAIALAALSLAIRPASAQTETLTQRGIAELVEVRATVTAINLKDRLVTLKGPQRSVTVYVDKKIPNLSKVKIGDEVDVDYYEALAIELDQSGATPVGVQVKEGVSLPTSSTSNVGVAARQVTLTSKIFVVNRGDNSVTFEGPDGYYRWVKVKDPELQTYLRKLKYGDTIRISYTEALAVGFEPVNKGA